MCYPGKPVALWLILLACLFTSPSQAETNLLLRVGTFRCDATPPIGETVIWDMTMTNVDDPLWIKGVVLDDGRQRYVICALDWCELANDARDFLRQKMAAAARTEMAQTAIQCVHQHTAPYADTVAHQLLDAAPQPLRHLSAQYLNELGNRLAETVRQSLDHLETFDQIGTGEAKVDRVASIRRLHGAGGKIIVRYSEGAKNPAMAAAPEGPIDPMLKTDEAYAEGGYEPSDSSVTIGLEAALKQAICKLTGIE